MQFKVRDWMMEVVVFVDPDIPVTEALALMRRRYINSLIVNKSKGNPHWGIVTSIDICDKIVAQDRNPADIKVREIMTSPLITVHTDMTLKECSIIMRENHIHHLPVVDTDDHIVGMISATDFLVAAEAMARKEGERFS